MKNSMFFKTENRRVITEIRLLDGGLTCIRAIWSDWNHWVLPPHWHKRTIDPERDEKVEEIRNLFNEIQSIVDEPRIGNGWSMDGSRFTFTVPNSLLGDVLHAISCASELDATGARDFISKYGSTESDDL